MKHRFCLFLSISLFATVPNDTFARDWLQPLPPKGDEVFVLEDFRFVPYRFMYKGFSAGTSNIRYLLKAEDERVFSLHIGETFDDVTLLDVDASQKTLTEVSLKIKAYNEEFLYKDDTKGMIADILQYASEPLERRKSGSLSDIYNFMEAANVFEKRVSEARLENESYIQALKEVAKERVGTSDEKIPVVEGGHGKETHDQREELKKVSDRLDKLSKRQAGQNTDQKAVKTTKEQVRNAQQRLKLVKNNGNEL